MSVGQTEQSLVEASRRGDRVAFAELVRRTARLVFARVYLEIGRSDRVEDLVQETFMVAWRSIRQVTDANGFRSWLIRVAQTVVIDAQRRDSRKKRSGTRAESGTLRLVADDGESPADSAEKEESRQRVLADSISRSVTRSSDDQNTVDSKIRIQVRLLSIDRIAPRDTQTLAVATADVPVAYQALLATLQELGSRIIASQLNESDPQNVTATLDFEVFRDLPRSDRAVPESSLSRMESALKEAGVVYSRSVSRATDTQNTIENKVRMIVQLANVTQLTPRQHSKLMLEVADVDSAAAQVLSAVASMGGQKIASTQARSGQGQVSGHLVVVIPLDKGDLLREAVRKLGTLRVSETREDWAAPGGQIGRARFEITFATPDRIVTEGQGIGAALRNALSISASGLFWSVQMIVVGLLFVGPWALVLWGLWKLARRRRAATA